MDRAIEILSGIGDLSVALLAPGGFWPWYLGIACALIVAAILRWKGKL
jgi:hypothetical protein